MGKQKVRVESRGKNYLLMEHLSGDIYSLNIGVLILK